MAAIYFGSGGFFFFTITISNAHIYLFDYFPCFVFTPVLALAQEAGGSLGGTSAAGSARPLAAGAFAKVTPHDTKINK